MSEARVREPSAATPGNKARAQFKAPRTLPTPPTHICCEVRKHPVGPLHTQDASLGWNSGNSGSLIHLHLGSSRRQHQPFPRSSTSSIYTL